MERGWKGRYSIERKTFPIVLKELTEFNVSPVKVGWFAYSGRVDFGGKCGSVKYGTLGSGCAARVGLVPRLVPG